MRDDRGRQTAEQCAKIFKVRAFFEFDVKILLGEIKKGEIVILKPMQQSLLNRGLLVTID